MKVQVLNHEGSEGRNTLDATTRKDVGPYPPCVAWTQDHKQPLTGCPERTMNVSVPFFFQENGLLTYELPNHKRPLLFISEM